MFVFYSTYLVGVPVYVLVTRKDTKTTTNNQKYEKFGW